MPKGGGGVVVDDEEDDEIDETAEDIAEDEEDFDLICDGHVEPNRTRRLPDVVIIGSKKGGTRALIEFLKLHPKAEFQCERKGLSQQYILLNFSDLKLLLLLLQTMVTNNS